MPLERPNPRLFGRTRELAQAKDLLQKGERLIVLRGSPGVGKTALVQALREGEPQGSCMKVVSFAETNDRVGFLACFARSIGLETRSSDPYVLLDRIAKRMDSYKRPLFLDNVDHVLETARGVLSDLLDAVPNLTVVLAARSRLGLSVEHVLPVAPLLPVDAALLLRDRMARAGTMRTISEEEVSLLCARVGNLPLAIEILAARVASLGPAAVLAALKEGDLQLDALDRSLDGSWNFLSLEERHALALLSVFRGDFSTEAARGVLGARGFELLSALVTSSLLVATPHDERTRYAMLEGVRHYAQRRARELGVQTTAHKLHCMHYTSTYAPPSDHRQAWTRLDEDRENLFSAWEWAIENDRVSARSLAVAIGLLLLTHGPAAPHRYMLVDTLATYEGDGASPAMDRAARTIRVEMLLALGRIDAQTGQNALAARSFQEAHSKARQIADPARANTAAALLAFVLRPLGRYDEARVHAKQALDYASEPGRERLLGGTLQSLGMIALATDRHEDAIEYFRRGAALGSAEKAPRLEGISLANLGLAHQAAQRWEEALDLFQQAAARFDEVHDHFHLARMRAHKGALLAECGEFVAAEGELHEAHNAVLDQGDLEGELEVLRGRVLVAIGQGEKLLAERRLDDLELAARRTDEISWGPRIARLRALVLRMGRAGGPRVRLSRDGRTLKIGSQVIDLRRRGPLRLLLVALVSARISSPGTFLTVDALREAGWPKEKMRTDSAAARVYMAIRRLRSLGFEPLLLTYDEGYALEASADIGWADA